MDVTCTSMKASLMLDDKNILWCNIDREAHLSERKPNHTPHIPAALLKRIALRVHHEHFCPECCCRFLTKQSCTGSPCITEYTKCESVRIQSLKQSYICICGQCAEYILYIPSRSFRNPDFKMGRAGHTYAVIALRLWNDLQMTSGKRQLRLSLRRFRNVLI